MAIGNAAHLGGAGDEDIREDREKKCGNEVFSFTHEGFALDYVNALSTYMTLLHGMKSDDVEFACDFIRENRQDILQGLEFYEQYTERVKEAYGKEGLIEALGDNSLEKIEEFDRGIKDIREVLRRRIDYKSLPILYAKTLGFMNIHFPNNFKSLFGFPSDEKIDVSALNEDILDATTRVVGAVESALQEKLKTKT